MPASARVSPLPKGLCNSPWGSTSLSLLLLSLPPHLLHHSKLLCLLSTHLGYEHCRCVLPWAEGFRAHAGAADPAHTHWARHYRGQGLPHNPCFTKVMNLSQEHPGTGAPQQQHSKEQADEISLDLLVHVKDFWILLRLCGSCCHLATVQLQRENR